MRREPDYFGEEELPLLFIAKRLRDALRLEQVLTEAGFDYLVETDTYHGGIIFRTKRVGAFFYVRPNDAEAVRELMGRSGFEPYQAGA